MPTAASDSPATGLSELVLDAPRAAQAVELRYVHDDEAGFSRRRCGRGHLYRDVAGARVTDAATLARIAALAIPPAWTHVWICASADGHVQATGRDARGRKQYRYHARFRSVREEAKFEHLLAFGRALPALRARIAADLAEPALGREKVIATVLRIMERTCIRVGNASYASQNGSYGLTTLRSRHARFRSGVVAFSFVGKSGVPHRIELRDARLAAIVRRCHDLPGQRLFQWIDDAGARHAVTSTDVNAYLRDATRGPFSAKMLRTWSASVSSCERLLAAPPAIGRRATKATFDRAVGAVAAELGNTVAVCRRSYVHPAIAAAHEAGTLRRELRRGLAAHPRRDDGLRPIERAFLGLLAHGSVAAPIARAG